MTSAESLLEEFRKCSYRLDVEAEFVQRYFDDRRCISNITRTFLERDEKFRSLFKSAGLPLKLQLGTHLFGLSTVEEHFALDLIVRTLKPRRILEIGVFRGQTAITMARALSLTTSEASLTGIDIDKTAVGIADEASSVLGLSQIASFVNGDSHEVLPSLPPPDLVFIDGDHAFESVARDFVYAYNIIGTGGLIAMHDVGSRIWGYHQDPGWLFYRVLPELLKNQMVHSWLDSMCRELTMQLLSPNQTLHVYCESNEEALELARLTSIDTINGAGGLGFVVKLDGAHTLALEDVLSKGPCQSPTAPKPVTRPLSLLGRAARRIASWIP